MKNSTRTTTGHTRNARSIIQAVAEGGRPPSPETEGTLPGYLSAPAARDYQRHVYDRFGDVIRTPSFDYISKIPSGWLIVGDHRAELAARIALIVERHGVGVGMMVLHAQQMCARHIPIEIPLNGESQDLALPTRRLRGTRGESVLYVPVRKYRDDFGKLADLNIVKPQRMWDESRIVSHERDHRPCLYCSCAEINPSEVVVTLDGARRGLSRNYSLGFTFAPFGDPVSVMHFLAWDSSENPLNMNRTPMTVSDLVQLTQQVNVSILTFFAGTGVEDFPVIDGVSNGWAGNSIYHQHFQFFQPEFTPPISVTNLLNRKPLLTRDDVEVHRLSWETPVYKVVADEPINVGLVGNDIAGAWRLLGGAKKIGYKEFPDGHVVREDEKVPVHTQNLYIPGAEFGRTAYILLRDRRRIDFEPARGEYVNKPAGRKAQPKSNIGVLEATGTPIVDEAESFEEMATWEPTDITTQIDKMARAVQPERSAVNRFEKSIRDLFPR